MKVREIMTRGVHLLSPDQTIRDAIRKMAVEYVAAVLIAEQDHLVGMVTERDIAVRAVAAGEEARTRTFASAPLAASVATAPIVRFDSPAYPDCQYIFIRNLS
jgi:CBS domain-containing protein